MKLEELINAYPAQLNDNDQQILQQIIAHQIEYANYSCAQMAEACATSRATLLRTLRKLHPSSFSDLTLLLQTQTEEEPLLQDDVYDAFHSLVEELRKFSYHDICDVLYHCETIYIYGTGNEQKTLAAEFKRIFLSVGKCVIDAFDYGELTFMKETFHECDVFIIISLSGETKDGIEILRMIQPTNIQTISITRLQNNTISQMCEHNLYVATKVVRQSRSQYEMVSAFYVLMDLLFINYLDYRKEMENT